MTKTVFETLNAIDVSKYIEKKKSGGKELSYLSWDKAWAEVKKLYPKASYEIKKFNNLPYVEDANTGYMVYTTVTIEDITHEMWLPVMDGNNKAMRSEPYKVTFKSGKSITVEKASMFDVNKTIMRCLTKNLAMHGLGLYIYSGEDLPEVEKDRIIQLQTEEQENKSLIIKYAKELKDLGVDMQKFYFDVAKKEECASVKDVPKHKLLGHMKAEKLALEKPQQVIQEELEVVPVWN